ncbi:hypothetical protein [Pseudomonas costantinii]|uniref:hypothetical protein n=1 Tax=Pseudomonas costantinii TaxID=168469 RepID=UPI0015A42EAA|nr:hypothetical protein [Pseudomonas costantinii]NVZ70477.1 hypothetical protein [Pseudomonas costantinii]
MSEPILIFKCLGHTKRDDGSIGRYHLVVSDTKDGEIEEISVEAKHLMSARSMKRILLGRKMFYSVTQTKHEKMLSEMFDQQQLEAIND